MENQIQGSCPHCQQTLLIPNVKAARFSCPYCQNQVIIFNGQLLKDAPPSAQPDAEAMKQRARRTRNFLLIGGGALLVFILAYTLFLRQYWAYQRAMDSSSVYAGEYYLESYPNGRYVDEVKGHIDDLDYEEATYALEGCEASSCECESYDQYLDKYASGGKHTAEAQEKQQSCFMARIKEKRSLLDIETMRRKYPNSKYTAELTTLREQIWDGLIADFESGSSAGKGKAFFGDLMRYARSSGESAIYVQFSHETDLKDWNDFPKEIHETYDALVDMFNETPDPTDGRMERPSDSPPPSVKEYFTESNLGGLEEELCKKLEETMTEVFSNQIFMVKPYSEAKGTPKIVISIDYKIANLIEDGLPSLYQQYNRNEYSARRTFEGHMLGVFIDWQFRMNMPEGKGSFAFEDRSEPASEFNNIGGLSDAYQRMTESSFHNFADNIAWNFGMRLMRRDGDGGYDMDMGDESSDEE